MTRCWRILPFLLLAGCLPDGSRIQDGFLGSLKYHIDLISGANFHGTQWDSTNRFVRLDTLTNNAELDASWTPQWNHLVALWKMNSFGNIPTTSFNPERGLTNCTATHAGLAYESGKLNTGIAIYRDRYISCTATPVTSISNDITIMFWFKHSGGNVIPFQVILDPLTAGVAGWSVSRSGTSNALQVRVDTSAQTNAICVPASVTYMDGTWHQIVYTISSGTIRVYIDGRLARSCGYTHGSGFASNKANMALSGLSGTALTSYDELAIWSTVLTPAEIATIHDRQSAKYSGSVLSPTVNRQEKRLWRSLSVTTTLPFLKPLPGASGSEETSAYSGLGPNLMQGLVGLWKLDETVGTTFTDSSGEGNTANGIGALGTTACSTTTYTSNCLSAYGIFSGGINTAGTITAAHHVEIPNSTSLENVQEDNSTYSAWYFPRAFPLNVDGTFRDQNHGILIKEGSPFGLTFDASGYFVFTMYDNSAAIHTVTSTSVYTLGQWYHVVGVYNRTDGFLNLYVNGSPAGSTNVGTPITTFEYGTTTWKIGAARACSSASCWPAFGVIDEVAIWNRALTDGSGSTENEIFKLYRRGANRLRYQIRTCATQDCAAEDADTANGQGWKGPDNTVNSYFSELNNNTVPQAMTGDVKITPLSTLFTDFNGLEADLNAKPWFQGRAILESDQSSTSCDYGGGGTPCSPELQSLTADPELTLP